MRLERVAHLVRITVPVGDRSCRFLVDTGIGVNVVSSVLVSELGLAPTGESFSGRRMSGQVVETPLVSLPPLTVDRVTVGDQVAGVADLGPADGPDGFAGILGLPAFAGTSVTIDPVASTLSVGASEAGDAWSVPLELRVDGPSLTPFVTLTLPGVGEVTVELDTGSESLILDESFRAGLELAGEVEERAGVDETGYSWTRRFSTLAGSIHLTGAAETGQERPRVMFQEIIHDGLLGTAYLDRYRYTVDVAGSRLRLAPPN